jgi:hypothetical protein
VGWEAHVTSRDPTFDAVGTRSCAIRRGMSKKRSEVVRSDSDECWGVCAGAHELAPAWLQARRYADTPIRRHRVLCDCGYAAAASFVTFCVHSL